MQVILEPIPEKKITYKKGKHGIIYVYYITRSYRNKYGNPTGDEALIGKKADVPGMFIPNKRYYTLFPERKPTEYVEETKIHPPAIIPYKIKHCGEPIVMLEVARQIGLLGILQESFPTKWKEMLVVAFYMVSQSKAMSYIEDWFDESSIDLVNSMNDVKCSRLFESISYEEMQVFFSAWAKHRSEREYIFLLDKLSVADKIPQRYKDHFKIEVQSKKKFTFELDLVNVNQELKQLGYFVLLTNNPDLTSSEVLKIYRLRDLIEKHFDQLKNELDFKRLRTHKQKTAEGKLFVGFIALILHSYMLNVIKNNPKTDKLTFEKVLIELKKIRSVVMSDMQETLITLNNLQKTILDIFRVNKNMLPC
jgi:hypothetical protein